MESLTGVFKRFRSKARKGPTRSGRMKRWEQEMKAVLLKAVHTLDPTEQAVLREFTIQEQQTLHLPFEHPAVGRLLSKGVLQIVSRFARGSMLGPLFPMKISEDVKTLLTDGRLGLLESRTMQQMSRPEIRGYAERLQATRPAFVYQIDNF